jgi:6-pyruvoyltetrahydropterin/6-carboxytetrahydropterin synthase
LYLEAKKLLSRFEKATIAHVKRENNAGADKIANLALDEQGSVGNFVVDFQNAQQSLFSLEKEAPYEGKHTLSGNAYEDARGTYQLSVKDHFDAAHTLPRYKGPCRYLHGHTWDVEVTIEGKHLDEVGILYDFKAIKDDLHTLLDNFDHRYINDCPPFDRINPTAENLARVIFYELEKTLPQSIALQEVAIWESPQAKVVYRP